MRRGFKNDAAVPSPSENAAAPLPTSEDALQLQVGVADREGDSERDGVRLTLGVDEMLREGVRVRDGGGA